MITLFKNDNPIYSPINTPYSSEILEICTLTSDSVDITCDSTKLQCKLCTKKFVKKKMRNHVGFHVINKHVEFDARVASVVKYHVHLTW